MTPVGAVASPDLAVTFACDVAEGLAKDPKRIPSRYLYDGLGSQLFEAICELPWYKITRGERSLLEQHAEAILRDLGTSPTLIELGAGNGEKLSLLLKSRGDDPDPMRVHLVDISATALGLSSRTLGQLPRIEVVLHETTYERGLQEACAQVGRARAAMVVFLGSNIGNMAPAESEQFLRDIWRGCRSGDRFLLGADLVKPERDLLAAYNDPLGVTAAFNKNVLVRLNRELDGDFDLEAFEHHAVWNADAARIESYLVSRIEQGVCLRGAGCCIRLAEGEPIWTESSHKYEAEQIVYMAKQAGFSLRQQWIDPESRFALTLLEA